MSSFGTTQFRVHLDDKYFPSPFMDSDGSNHYQATVLVESRAAIKALMDAVAIVTPKRALGTKTTVFHFEVGDDDTLTVPGHAGQLYSYAAVLIKCEPKGYGVWGAFYTADCEWLLAGDITP